MTGKKTAPIKSYGRQKVDGRATITMQGGGTLKWRGETMYHQNSWEVPGLEASDIRGVRSKLKWEGLTEKSVHRYM